jgi:uncharacterized tellurite resistance protein B-like protein
MMREESFMTVQEVITEIRRLSFEDRLELLRLLNESLQSEQQTKRSDSTTLNRVRGLLKPDGPLPDDEELRDAYVEHLMEKYT